MVNNNRGRTSVSEIFSRVEVENRHFRPLVVDRLSLAEKNYHQHNVIYTSLENNLVSYKFLQFCRLVAVAFQICENHAKFRENSNL